MEYLSPILTKLRSKGVHIVVNTRHPEEHNEEYAIQAEDAIAAMQEIRYLDKLIDELSKGKTMEKILRKQ